MPSSPSTAADLAADTAVQPLAAGPGWYTAALPASWDFVTPSGGVLMSVALRAMRAELGDDTLRPISATTLFCSPVPAGPLEIRVEVLRRGNAAAQLRAALSSTSLPGPGLEVSATFTRDRSGPAILDARFPGVPAPAEAYDLHDGTAGNPHDSWPFFANFHLRLAAGDRWWEPGWQGGVARHARWFRYRVPQRRDGLVDPFAIPPIADTMPSSVLQFLGPVAERPVAPSLDLTVHFLEDTACEWLLVSCFSRHARAAGIAILDGVYLDLADEDGFAASCRQGVELGFDGKTLIHPKQLAAANEAFAPSADEVAFSRKIIEAHAAAEAEGKGVLVVDGKLIENLHVENARRLVALAEAIAAQG